MKGKKLFISVVITLIFAGTILLLLYPGGSPLGNLFDVFFLLIVTHYLALGYGLLVLILRILRILKNNGLLVYLLAGTLNIFLAVVGICMFIMDQADIDWMHNSIGNLMVGFLIISDALLLKTPAND
jgi:hypothetical protein